MIDWNKVTTIEGVLMAVGTAVIGAVTTYVGVRIRKADVHQDRHRELMREEMSDLLERKSQDIAELKTELHQRDERLRQLEVALMAERAQVIQLQTLMATLQDKVARLEGEGGEHRKRVQAMRKLHANDPAFPWPAEFISALYDEVP